MFRIFYHDMDGKGSILRSATFLCVVKSLVGTCLSCFMFSKIKVFKEMKTVTLPKKPYEVVK